jgi:hypothetical protein
VSTPLVQQGDGVGVVSRGRKMVTVPTGDAFRASIVRTIMRTVRVA